MGSLRGTTSPPWTALAFLISMLSMTTMSSGLLLDFCSDLNTAPRNTGNYSIWQTIGLCHDFCLGEFSFAVVRENNCWCSNVEPDETRIVDTDDCDKTCPGYDTEFCGGDGLWGYVTLGKRPTATAGGPTSPTTTPKPSSTPEESEPSEPTISRVTITEDSGTVRTVTFMPTSSVDLEGSMSGSESSGGGGGLSSTSIIGIAVGVVCAVILVVGGWLWWWFVGKRRRRQEQESDDPSNRGSSAGILGGSNNRTPDMAETRPTSKHLAGPAVVIHNKDMLSASDKRLSRLEVDPRMDPYRGGLYARSYSRESVNTVRDDHDYSRPVHQPKVLRAVNPDPTPDG